MLPTVLVVLLRRRKGEKKRERPVSQSIPHTPHIPYTNPIPTITTTTSVHPHNYKKKNTHQSPRAAAPPGPSPRAPAAPAPSPRCCAGGTPWAAPPPRCPCCRRWARPPPCPRPPPAAAGRRPGWGSEEWCVFFLCVKSNPSVSHSGHSDGARSTHARQECDGAMWTALTSRALAWISSVMSRSLSCRLSLVDDDDDAAPGTRVHPHT